MTSRPVTRLLFYVRYLADAFHFGHVHRLARDKKVFASSMFALLGLRLAVVIIGVTPSLPHRGLLVSALLLLMAPFIAGIQTVFNPPASGSLLNVHAAQALIVVSFHDVGPRQQVSASILSANCCICPTFIFLLSACLPPLCVLSRA